MATARCGCSSSSSKHAMDAANNRATHSLEHQLALVSHRRECGSAGPGSRTHTVLASPQILSARAVAPEKRLFRRRGDHHNPDYRDLLSSFKLLNWADLHGSLAPRAQRRSATRQFLNGAMVRCFPPANGSISLHAALITQGLLHRVERCLRVLEVLFGLTVIALTNRYIGRP